MNLDLGNAERAPRRWRAAQLLAPIAVATFAALVHYVALHQGEGAHAPLTGLPPVRGALVATSAFGFALFIFTVGYQAGPRFFDVLKTDGAKYLAIALIVNMPRYSPM